MLSRSLQAAQQELERHRAMDSLKRNLEKRPEREELIERTQSNTQYLHRQRAIPLT